MEGLLTSEDNAHNYPIRNGIPRFVPDSNYADSFGLQWNLFAKTQLDSHSGHSISAERFWSATTWEKTEMENTWVLDVGCGSGRFAEIALSSGAQVVALDYSEAVDACYENLKDHPNLHVIQGDIYQLPLLNNSFEFVYSLGVLQHTPDVEKAFHALPHMLKPGGQLCVDYYEKSWKSLFYIKYYLRPITCRLRHQTVLNLVEVMVTVLLPVSRLFSAIPVLGRYLKRIIPIESYYGVYPLSQKQHRDWSVLDTFDWLTPAYDKPQTRNTIRVWMQQAGLQNVEVEKIGHIVARGRKS
ncbi:MAG: class I SAM-dependent methyltransferase [Gammaproteobacteria bacterium]